MFQTDLKLGKQPFVKDERDFLFKKYVVKSKLPTYPKKGFGHQNLISNWGMLANDQYGDCYWASSAHQHMIRGAEGGKPIIFRDQDVLSDYSKCTGFNPNDPNSDQGTQMRDGLKYRRKYGIIDANGVRHPIDAFLQMQSWDEVLLATYLFGATDIGIEFPDSAMNQFDAGKTWTVVRGAQIEGGHAIAPVAYNGTNLLLVTWGKLQAMNKQFFNKYCDEAWLPVSFELLNQKGVSPEGFKKADLQADINSL